VLQIGGSDQPLLFPREHFSKLSIFKQRVHDPAGTPTTKVFAHYFAGSLFIQYGATSAAELV
jgi:hypothetical protein